MAASQPPSCPHAFQRKRHALLQGNAAPLPHHPPADSVAGSSYLASHCLSPSLSTPLYLQHPQIDCHSRQTCMATPVAAAVRLKQRSIVWQCKEHINYYLLIVQPAGSTMHRASIPNASSCGICLHMQITCQTDHLTGLSSVRYNPLPVRASVKAYSGQPGIQEQEMESVITWTHAASQTRHGAAERR